MEQHRLLQDYDRLHEEFFAHYAAMLVALYQPQVEAKALNDAVEAWRRVRAADRYMDFDVGQSARERLAHFTRHAQYLQEDDVLEREFDECIACEHDYMTDEIDAITAYTEAKERIWSGFITAVETLAGRYR